MRDATLLRDNLERLRQNPYPGRGLIMGVNEDVTCVVQVGWLMARSASNRNRVLTAGKDGSVRTAVADPAQPIDPVNTIYTMMAEAGGYWVLSNGKQTDPILQGLVDGHGFIELVTDWEHENDAPIYTQRITGMYSRRTEDPFGFGYCLHDKHGGTSGTTRRHFHSYMRKELRPGVGYCVHTYAHDGNPPPPFYDTPLQVPLWGSQENVLKSIWTSLNSEHRVAIAVKFIDMATGESRIAIHNKYKQVSGL